VIIQAHDETTGTSETSSTDNVKPDPRYRHQEEAVEWFTDPERANGTGILWMATGTGKTITALKIVDKLFSENKIDAFVLCTTEHLLDQWNREMRNPYPGTTNRQLAPWRKADYRHTGKKKEMGQFRQSAIHGKCLFITYSFLPDFLTESETYDIDLSRTILVVDEVHHLGAEQISFKLRQLDETSRETRLASIQYKLGLSATPFNDYDQERNIFLLNAICSTNTDPLELPAWIERADIPDQYALKTALCELNLVLYFGIEDAIRSEILVPFDYLALDYIPTAEEKEKRLKIMRLMQAKVKEGTAKQTDVYIAMSNVYKCSVSKIEVFKTYLETLNNDEMSRLLHRAIIFVHDRAFGKKVSAVVHSHTKEYHGYYHEDDPSNLHKFCNGKLNLLLTCHMISEGIDIRDLSSVILFSSDRSRLETIQRIGRALRRDPSDVLKIAHVLDFTYIEDCPGKESESSDENRKLWLAELSGVRANGRS
ncbi:MAG TPA: DEAD/DEAH box helicase, partial [Flavobacteriales bacterium]|nr:DEAD/DEAH box helicase [Flavobacteriales bacterium]